MSYRAESQNWIETTSASKLFRNIYLWMTIGLGITGLVAWLSYDTGFFLNILRYNTNLIFVLPVLQIGLVFAFRSLVFKSSVGVVSLLFTSYAIVNGVAFSVYFFIFELGSIATVFFITAGTFAVTTIYAMTTKRSLEGIGGILKMALIGIIIASLANWFIQSDALYYGISYIGVAVFVGLTAYHTQKIKKIAQESGDLPEDEFVKLSLCFALTLYLDFINLFIMLLRIMGKRR